MMKRGMYAVLVGLIVILAAGCGGVQSNVGKEGDIKKVIGTQRSSDFIETIGIGAADQNISNTTQRRSLSREAAIVRAQYEMLSVVRGVQYDGGNTVESAMVENSKMTTKVSTLIKGAEVIRTEWTADDGAIVTLRLEKKRLDTILKQYQK